MTLAAVKLQADAFIDCPHCGMPNQDPVADWVIPGHVGDASRCRGECEHCDNAIDVEYDGESYLVSAA